MTLSLVTGGNPVSLTEDDLRAIPTDERRQRKRSGRQRAWKPTHVDAATPPRLWRVLCPRHLWPAVHEAIRDSRAALTTGACDTALELLLSDRALDIVRRFGLEVCGVGSDPWPGRLKAGAGRQAYRDAGDAHADDPLEVAWRTFMAEKRGDRRAGKA